MKIDGPLVCLAISRARNSGGVLGKPSPHLLIGPHPLEGVGVEAVVLRPGRLHMGDVFLPTRPRAPLQVAIPEGVVEPLPLVQPRGMRRGQPGPPPTLTTIEIVGRQGWWRPRLTPAHASDRKSTRLNSSHPSISYAVFCLKKKKKQHTNYIY